MKRSFGLNLIVLCVTLAMAALLFAGCQNQPAGNPTQAPTQAPAAQQPDDQTGPEPAKQVDNSEYTGSIQFLCWDTT